MTINNFSEFYNIINSCGLSTTSPFNNFVQTVDKYLAACECLDSIDKSRKLDDAKTLYISIVKGPISSYINTIKSKRSTSVIHFYNNGSLIASY